MTAPIDAMRPRDTAIEVRYAYKRYSPKAVILKGLNMTVPEGIIYGLLGPSGCGKTTLLSCIVGMKRLDSGKVALSARSRLDVGFMPQEISLNTEFTIREVLHFYGRIHGLLPERIDQRIKELTALLELPQDERLIGSCSGGQQRRISMAVTLLHDPRILILDEPTAGVDPLLSASIWEHFTEMVESRGKTVIITTHYIEECRNAGMIGLMRNGVLLAEEPPTTLLNQFNCDTLEEVFLKLSELQEVRSTEDEAYPPIRPNEPPIPSNGDFNRGRFMAQLSKNWNWTKRNLPITVFVIALPALLFTILGNLSKSDVVDYPLPPAPVAIYNEEIDCRNNTVRSLRNNCEPTRPFSCRLAERFDALLGTVNVDSLESGMKLAQTGEIFGVIKFSANFSEFMMDRLILQTTASKQAIDMSTLEVWFDMSDFGYGIRSVRDFGMAVVNLMQDVCSECGFERKIAAIPVEVKEINPSKSIFHTLMPPYFGSIAFYTTMMYTSSAIVMERASGLIERSKTAGLTTTEIITAQIVMQFFTMTLQNVLSFFILYIVTGHPLEKGIPVPFLLINLVEVCGMSYGFLLSLLIREEKFVAYSGIFTVLTLFMTTGTVWPREGMHWAMKPFSNIIPVTLTAEGYLNSAIRALPLDHRSVYLGVVSSLSGTAFFTGLCVIAVKLGWGQLE